MYTVSEIPDSGVFINDDPICFAHDSNEDHDIIRVKGEYTVDIELN